MSIKKYKVCRRLGSSVYEKCSTPQYNISEQKKRLAKTGKRPKMLSDYGKKLLEKQKLRLTYGLKERALSKYVRNALSSKKDTVTSLNSTLEKRLDNVIYRLGLAATRRMARQVVVHGHILVNGRKLNVPSYQVRVGDKIAVKEGSRENRIFAELANKDLPKLVKWLSFDYSKKEGEVKKEPEVSLTEFDFKKIIEFYTR